MYTHMKHGMTFYVISMTSYYALLTHPVPRCQFASQSFFLQTTCIFPPQQQCMVTFLYLVQKIATNYAECKFSNELWRFSAKPQFHIQSSVSS